MNIFERDAALPTMSLSEYREYVEAAALRMDGVPIYNGSLDHARIVIEVLLRTAERTVDIVCRKLSNDVWGSPEVLHAVDSFLNRPESKMRVLVEESVDGEIDGNAFMQFVSDKNVEIFQLDEIVSEISDVNSIVVDGTSYRAEDDRDGRAAVVVFKANIDRVSKLESLFELLKRFGNPICVMPKPLTA